MNHNIFRFGILWLNDKIQPIPQRPERGGDIPQYDGQASISIASANQGESITWVKPSGLNLLVADRILLLNVSWQDLDNNGFVAGKRILIGGQYFRCRLLQTGENEGVDNEWDEILNITGTENGLWHWQEMYFWGKDVICWDPQKSLRMVRGYLTARACYDFEADYQDAEVIGFRPVLEPLGSNSPVILGTQLDGLSFRMSNLPGGKGFWPVLQPVQKEAFSNIQNGRQVKMYSFMENGRPVHIDEKVKDPTKLTLTDCYYGDEYLIPWTISNGVAVVNQPLFV